MNKKIITLLFGITASLLLSGCGSSAFRNVHPLDRGGELLVLPSDGLGCSAVKHIGLLGFARGCNDSSGESLAEGITEFYRDTPEKTAKHNRLLANIAKCNSYATRVTPLPTKEKVLSHYQTNIIIDESTLNANSLPPIVTTVPVYKEVRNRHTKEYIQNRTKCMQAETAKAESAKSLEAFYIKKSAREKEAKLSSDISMAILEESSRKDKNSEFVYSKGERHIMLRSIMHRRTKKIMHEKIINKNEDEKMDIWKDILEEYSRLYKNEFNYSENERRIVEELYNETLHQ